MVSTLEIKLSVKRIGALMRKELELLIRDWKTLMIVFALPIFVITLTQGAMSNWFGLGGNNSSAETTPTTNNATDTSEGMDMEELGGGESPTSNLAELADSIGIVNLDYVDNDSAKGWTNYSTALYNALVEAIQSNGFKVTYYKAEDFVHPDDPRADGAGVPQAEDDLYEGRVIGYIVIPREMDKNTTLGIRTVFYTVEDGSSFSSSIDMFTISLTAIATFKFSENLFVDEFIPDMKFRFQPKDLDIQSSVMVPAIVTLMVMIGSLSLTSQCVVGDEPLRRMLLTPISKSEALIGKLFLYMIINFLQILVLEGMWILLFGGLTRGNIFLLLGMLEMGAFAGLTLGILFSSIATSRLQADQMMTLGIMGIAIFIIMGVQIINEDIDKYLNFPQTLFKGYFGVVFKGYDFATCASYYLRLFVSGVLMILAAWGVLKMKKSE